jgi:hypothetical protein
MAERVAVHEGRNGVTHDLFDLRVRGVMAAHVEGAARQVVWIISESGEPVVRGPRLDNLLGKGHAVPLVLLCFICIQPGPSANCCVNGANDVA